MVCNFHWRGSETEAGKFFIREYYFEPSKDNKRLLAINGKKLKTRTPAEGFFRGINRRIDPNKTMSEEAMRVIISGPGPSHGLLWSTTSLQFTSGQLCSRPRHRTDMGALSDGLGDSPYTASPP